ncbi:MAG: sensor histidine kinase [Bacteroidales bacterium]|nr:sensor histidine kinase [Bacteroidales bacterium]
MTDSNRIGSTHLSISRLLQNRNLQHILFWSFFVIIEIISTLERAEESERLWRFTLEIIRYTGTVFAVYVNFRILIPKLMEHKKYVAYFGCIILTLGVAAIIHFLVHLVFNTELRMPPGHTFKVSTFLIFSSMHTLMMLIMTSLLHFVKEWIRLKDIALGMNEFEKDKLEAELKALKAQINPHFLFNSLNNIYSLALDKSDKSPDLILKLSDLMSYIIYDCKDEKVRIGQELQFLKNYVDLEQVRVGERVNVMLEIDVREDHIEVAPLLFIPFIENAFKYVGGYSEVKPYIHIRIHDQQDEWIHLEVENNIRQDLPELNDKYHGIGIDNVKKRLELIYPGNYKLAINPSENTFNVKLRIRTYAN